jgi:hypothetical protein
MVTKTNAIKIAKDFSELIGEKYKGCTIDEFLITPKMDPEFSVAIKTYAKTMDSKLIVPASNEEGYTVTVVLNKKAWKSTGIMFYDDIINVIKNKALVLDHNKYGIILNN